MKNISYDVHSESIIYCFEEAESQIFAAQKQGVYKKVRKLARQIVKVNSQNEKHKAISGTYSFKLRGQEMISNLWVTGYKNNFIKIRFTYPKTEETEGKQTLAIFTEHIGGLLKE